MTIESKQYAEFESFEKITKPEELSLIREKISSTPSLTGIDGLKSFYQMMDMDFDEREFKNIINDCSSKLDVLYGY